MLRSVSYSVLFGACLWAIADACLGLENSWIIFLHRVWAPFSLCAAMLAGAIGLCFRSCRTKRTIVLWIALLIACCAPIIRSIALHTVSSREEIKGPQSLTVFNLNTLGHIDRSQRIIEEIERRSPDIVTLQEVNPELAHALQTRLAHSYPCQYLDPVRGSWGMGILAKESCSPVAFPIPDAWVGKPQIVQVARTGKLPLLVVNIHAIHPHAYFQQSPCCQQVAGLSDTVRAREAAIARVLATTKPIKSSAVVIAGDLNSTMRNTTYELIRAAGFRDSWLGAQSLLHNGATWPSEEFIRTPLLTWLLRIDFVFHCSALRPTQAELLPEDLGSDHRGIMVNFADSV